jgi:hypothetical protein
VASEGRTHYRDWFDDPQSAAIQDHLSSLSEMLENRITEVNERVSSGKNEYRQITRRGAKIVKK